MINVKVQASGLPTCSYSDMVTITSNGGKQSVQVSLMVQSSTTALVSRVTPSMPPQPAQMNVNLSSLNFGSMSAGTSQSMPLVVRNIGGAPLTWQTTSAGASWVTANPSHGILQPALSQIVTVTVNTRGFAHGPQSVTLTINSNGGNRQVAITLAVTATPRWVASTIPPGNSIYS
jgi:hypothetical protein